MTVDINLEAGKLYTAYRNHRSLNMWNSSHHFIDIYTLNENSLNARDLNQV